MNKLISIGSLGNKNCYLNVSMEEAIERFCKSEEYTKEEFKEYIEDRFLIDEFEFEDEFYAYEVGTC